MSDCRNVELSAHIRLSFRSRIVATLGGLMEAVRRLLGRITEVLHGRL
ncbi:MAG: hypothetical protein QXZ09_08615 [Candidatus Methanomethylicaceae archaeon]